MWNLRVERRLNISRKINIWYNGEISTHKKGKLYLSSLILNLNFIQSEYSGFLHLPFRDEGIKNISHLEEATREILFSTF